MAQAAKKQKPIDLSDLGAVPTQDAQNAQADAPLNSPDEPSLNMDIDSLSDEQLQRLQSASGAASPTSLREMGGALVSGAEEGVIGAGKGLAETAYSLGSKLHGWRQNLRGRMGAQPIPDFPTREEAATIPGIGGLFAPPEGAMQNIGYTGERMAEWLAPTGPVGRAERVAEGAIRGSRLAQKAARSTQTGLVGSAVRALPKGAEIASRAGIEAGAAGGMGAVQGDDPAASAEFAAKVAGLSTPLRYVASKRIAPRVVSSLVGPSLRKYFKFGGNPAEGLLEAGGAPTLGVLVDKLNSNKNSIGRALDTELAKASGQRIDAIPLVLGPVQAAITPHLRITGQSGVVDRIRDLALAQMQTISQLSGGTMRLNPAQLTAFKRDLGKMIQWTEDPVEKSAVDVMQDIYRAIDRKIDSVVPTAKRLNQRLANTITAEKAVEEQIKRVDTAALLQAGTVGIAGSVLAHQQGLDPTTSALMALPISAAARMMNTAAKTSIAKGLRATYPIYEPAAMSAAQAAQQPQMPGGTWNWSPNAPSPLGGPISSPPTTAVALRPQALPAAPGVVPGAGSRALPPGRTFSGQGQTVPQLEMPPPFTVDYEFQGALPPGPAPLPALPAGTPPRPPAQISAGARAPMDLGGGVMFRGPINLGQPGPLPRPSRGTITPTRARPIPSATPSAAADDQRLMDEAIEVERRRSTGDRGTIDQRFADVERRRGERRGVSRHLAESGDWRDELSRRLDALERKKKK